MSRFLLRRKSRHLPPWLTFDVRSIRSSLMKRHRQMILYRALARVALWTGSARIFSSLRIDWLGLAAFPYLVGEQTRGRDPTPPKQFRAVRRSNGFSRIIRFVRGVDTLSPRITTESRNIKRAPNNAIERSRILVTDRAIARSAPSIRLAHLGR